MNIAISGASGFIGKHLTEYLTEAGHRVIPLGRPMFREGTSGHLIQALSHCDVIINLAGAPIGKRWTPELKTENTYLTFFVLSIMKSNKDPQR